MVRPKSPEMRSASFWGLEAVSAPVKAIFLNSLYSASFGVIWDSFNVSPWYFGLIRSRIKWNHGFHESPDMTPNRTWVWVRNTIFTASWCKKVLYDYYGLSVITFEPSIFKTSFQRSAPHAPRPQYGFSSFTILWSENDPFSLKTKH